MEQVLDLATPAETEGFAQSLAPKLGAGDILLLNGPIGAGKTHFCRALITALLPTPEDIPSPTFTLVQVYDGPHCEIWHSDLYRLSHPDDAIELGLEEAFETAICLIEWPDRLADLAPKSALTLCFGAGSTDDARRLTLTWQDPKWAPMLETRHD